MSEDKRFDLELQEQLTDFDLSALPEEERVEPTPWQRTASRLVWGLGLSTITLNALYLDVILPAIGMLLLVQAFRPLRRENDWLRLCGGLAWVLCAMRFAVMVADATLLPEWQHYSILQTALAVTAGGTWLVFYFALWRGLLAVGRKAGQEQPSAPGAAMLLVWYSLLSVLALAGVEQLGWFFGLLLVAIYYFILRSLRKIVLFFEENGYVLQPAPVRVTDRALLLTGLAALLCAILLALQLGTRYPMDWQVRPAEEQAGCEEIVEELCALGLPENMAADLTPEELAALAGAERVLLGVGDSFTTEDGGKLQCRSAAIQLPGEEHWVFLQHFLWEELPRRRSTEALRITLPYEEYVPNGLVYFAADEALPERVRLLYNEGETTFTTSPELVSTTMQSWFGDEYTTRYAAWSLPRQGTAARGYLLYGLYRLDDASVVTATDYIHNQRAVYPYLSAREYDARGFWGPNPKFRTMQYQMYFDYDVL